MLRAASAAAWEVSMTDLHETSAPDPRAQIDAVGWTFVAVAIVIAAIAAMAAYHGNDTMIANAPVPHAVASSG